MDCCKKHGLPIKCLEQKLESNTETEHNNTHMVITTVISKECHDYKSVLQDCKKECMTGVATPKKLISHSHEKERSMKLRSRAIPLRGEGHQMPHNRGKIRLRIYLTNLRIKIKSYKEFKLKK